MAFIANKDFPKDPCIGKKFHARTALSNMAGTFEKGTLLICTDANKKAIWLSDELGNKILMNRVSSSVSLEPID